MSPAQVQSVGSRRRKEQRYRSVISDIFDGSILSLVQCLTCDRVCALRGEGALPSAASVAPLGLGVGCPCLSRGGGAGCRVSGSWGAGPLPHTCQLVAGTRGADCLI